MIRRECDDGAKCHHTCYDEECFRRVLAGPLSNTGCETWEEFDEMNKKMLTNAPWSASDIKALKAAFEVNPLEDVDTKEQFGVTPATVKSWLQGKSSPSRMPRLKVRAFVGRVKKGPRLKRTLKTAERVEFPTATVKPPQFRYFTVQGSGVHPDYVVALVIQSSERNAAKQDPVVIGNVRDVSGRWAARWSCPHQMTKREVIVSGYSTRDGAAKALLEAKRALKLGVL